MDDNGQPLIDEISGEDVYAAPDYEKASAKQMADYFRIDIGISFRMNYAHVVHIFPLDFQNVLNSENMRKIDYYDFNSNKYIYKRQTGIMPHLSAALNFRGECTHRENTSDEL